MSCRRRFGPLRTAGHPLPTASAPFDIAKLLAVLQYLAILFFVAGAAPLLGRWRPLRRLAIVAYALAFGLALAWVAVWLAS